MKFFSSQINKIERGAFQSLHIYNNSDMHSATHVENVSLMLLNKKLRLSMKNIKQAKVMKLFLVVTLLCAVFFGILGQTAYANDVVAAGEDFLDALFSAVYKFIEEFLADIDVSEIINTILEALLSLAIEFIEALEGLEIFDTIKEFIMSLFNEGTELFNDTMNNVENIDV